MRLPGLPNPLLPIAVLGAAILLTGLMHLPHFHKELMSIHVWRQTQTQTTIDNFFEEDRNILNPRRNNRGDGDGIFRMEFPLMQWLVAETYRFTGRSIFVTRAFMFLMGIGCVLGMYFFIKKILKDNLLSALSAWAFCFSPAFYYYMINPLPDVFALALGLHGLALTWKSNGPRLLFGLALLSLSALCKLPFGLFFLVPLVQQWSRPENGRQWAGLLAIGLFGLPPVIWYASVVPDWAGNGIVQGLFKSRASVGELTDYLLHNLVSTLPELLVNYAAMPFFLTGVYLAVRRNVPRKHPELLLLGLGLTAYFLFELNMIEKDHDYYLFPFYPLLFLAVGHGIRAFWGHANQKIRLVAVGLLALLPLTAGLRMQTRWQPERPGFNPDLLVHQRALQQAVPADALCIAGNDESGYIFFYYIDKKGWSFQQDEPTGTQLSDWRNRGAGYLYSDSREIENRATAEGLLDTLVAEHGSVRVFKLKSPR